VVGLVEIDELLWDKKDTASGIKLNNVPEKWNARGGVV
jgi:hypothetical protein